MTSPSARQRPAPSGVAVVVPAKDEAERVAATVASALSIEGVDLVIVVDDGSTDRTQHLAREAGATVVRHPRNRGKAAAMQTGAAAVAAREQADGTGPRALLFVDADLAGTAASTAPLALPVLAGEADMTIATLPAQSAPGGGRGLVVDLARRGIEQAVGFTAAQPLSGMRCLTREAYEAVLPLAAGWGVETALTIDVLRAGLRVQEVPCDLQHRVSGRDLRGQLHRAAQYRDVARALAARSGWRAVSALRPRRRPA